VHDHPALEHLGHAALDARGADARLSAGAVLGRRGGGLGLGHGGTSFDVVAGARDGTRAPEHAGTAAAHAASRRQQSTTGRVPRLARAGTPSSCWDGAVTAAGPERTP